MKKIAFLFLTVILINACNTDTVDAEKQKLLDDLKTLRTESAEKDSSFAKVLGYFSDIQNNLNEIKKREGIVNEVSLSGDGLSDQTKENVISDIQAINELLAENKNKIAELRSILGSKNNLLTSKDNQISELQSSLEQTLETMNLTVLQKDSEITYLKEGLTKLRISYDLLSMESAEKSEVIAGKTDALNTAYYCYGTYKELKEKGVLTKEGGFIGIGRSTKMTKNANLDYFTKIDITKTDQIELNTKQIELISNHPKSSYEIQRSADGKKVERLEIKDAQEFWSISKYLIIKVD